MTPDIEPRDIFTVADFRRIMGHDPNYPNFWDYLPDGRARSLGGSKNIPHRDSLGPIPPQLHSEKWLEMTPQEFFAEIDSVIRELGINPKKLQAIRKQSLEFAFGGDIDGSVEYERKEYFPLAEKIMGKLRERGFLWDDFGVPTFIYIG